MSFYDFMKNLQETHPLLFGIVITAMALSVGAWASLPFTLQRISRHLADIRDLLKRNNR